jgi:hypothetical protein
MFISPRRSFAITGPPTLLALLDRIVPMLEDGSDVPALVAALGRESLRPVVESIIGSLERHGMLLDPARLTTPEPTPSERTRFAGAIAHLETIAEDPNGALRRVRAAYAVVRGGGPQAASASEALVSSGFGDVSVEHPPGKEPEPLGDMPLPDPRAVEGVDDHQLEIAVALRGDDAGEEFASVPVCWTGGVLLCGPVVESDGDRDRHAALVRRVADWAEREQLDGATRPLGPMLAAAFAAHAAFERVGLGRGPGLAHVVHSALEADEIALDEASAVAAPAAPAPGPEESAGAEIAHATEAITAAGRLLERWSGLARWDMPGDLPQIPVAITVLAGRDSSVPERMLGWGTTEAHASLDAVLGLLRCAAWAGDGPGVIAAGRDERDGVLDGVLRLLLEELGTPEPLALSALDVEGRRRWRALTDGEGFDAHLVLAPLDGGELALAEIHGPDGETLASQWGLGAAAATSVLGAVIARRRAIAASGGPCHSCDPTSAVLVERPGLVDPVREAVERWLAAHDRTPHCARRGPDAVLRELPLWSGRVWFA